MIETYSTKERYEIAFNQVMDVYTNLKSTDGQVNQVYGKPVKVKGNVRLIQPSDQDFIVDVELAIKRVLLNKAEYTNLASVLHNDHDYYEDGIIPPKVDPEQMRRIKQRIGRELTFRRIYPVRAYFRGKVV